jgi:hypothetical protein
MRSGLIEELGQGLCDNRHSQGSGQPHRADQARPQKRHAAGGDRDRPAHRPRHGGSIAVEVVFNRQGIGWWLASSATQLDMPVLMCICLFMGVVFVFTNLILDIIYAYIDPRIRLA